MKPSTASEARETNHVRRLRIAGIVAMVLGFAACVEAWWSRGSDFACMYLTAVGLVEKAPIYDYAWQHVAFPARTPFGPVGSGMVYPPATGIMILPLGFVSFSIARTVWFLGMCTSVVLGVRAVLQIAWPQRAAQVWPLVAGVVLLSPALRWGMCPQQGAPLILGVLGLFTYAIYERKFTLALLLAVFAVSFKMTLALPFLGLLFLYRRYASIAIAIGFTALADVLGFVRLGGLTAWKEYQHNVGNLQAMNDINTPDPWNHYSVPRTDWTYLFYGVSRDLTASRWAGLACCAVVGLWLLWQAYQVRTPTLAHAGVFGLAFTCLTHLVVYHHQYDLSLLIAPMLLLAFGAPELRKPPTALWLMLPMVALMALAPVAFMQRFSGAHFGVIGRGLVNLSFSVALTLTFIGSLLLVRRTTATLAPAVALTAGDSESLDSAK